MHIPAAAYLFQNLFPIEGSRRRRSPAVDGGSGAEEEPPMNIVAVSVKRNKFHPYFKFQISLFCGRGR
jgi:hypothetical protein